MPNFCKLASADSSCVFTGEYGANKVTCLRIKQFEPAQGSTTQLQLQILAPTVNAIGEV